MEELSTPFLIITTSKKLLYIRRDGWGPSLYYLRILVMEPSALRIMLRPF